MAKKPLFIVKFSGDYLDLGKAEFEELFLTDCRDFSKKENLFFIYDDIFSEQDKYARLGLTKEIYKILSVIKGGTVKKCLTMLDVGLFESSFKISTAKNLNSDEKMNSKICADMLFETHKDNSFIVDINSPEHEYICFFRKNIFIDQYELFFCEKIFTNKDVGENRRSHLKIRNHPTSSHPKILRAMINLANSSSFHDPFCGAGGLLIEGGLMGLGVSGSDLDKLMIIRAKENINSFDLSIHLEVVDALDFSEKQEAIITDLPFGKNSTTKGKSIEELYFSFILHSEDLTDILVIGFENESINKFYLRETSWKLKRSISYYVHKNMTRTIWLLRK